MILDVLDAGKFQPEAEAIAALLASPPLTSEDRAVVRSEAEQLVRTARRSARRQGVVEGFLQEFSLGTREGLALMCLAEALLRTPDLATRDALIAEKIGSADWAAHLGRSENLFVNASTWGLMLTGRLIDVDQEVRGDAPGFVKRLANRVGEPVVRTAVAQAIRIMGDDWFHYGAFRQTNYDYIVGQTTQRGAGIHVPHPGRDDYSNFLAAGSGAAWAEAEGIEKLPYVQTIFQHPAYDAFWQTQALDKLIAKTPLTVPTMWEQGLWDQEDMWGGIHSYRAWEPQDKTNRMNFLVMGPWFHSQINRQGKALGPMQWATDTAQDWRRDVLLPFFNQYLIAGAPKADTPPVFIYNTSANHWDRLESWPLACEQGCATPSKPMYLTAGGGLSFTTPAKGSAFDEYVSDPAKPVPYRPRPVDPADSTGWRTWLVSDQRFVDGRPDVLTFETEPLTEPLKLAGEPVAHLFASTSGTDSDWVVKIIDVYPERDAPGGDNGGVFPGVLGSAVDMSGYELPIATDIFRGRYRTSFEHAAALKPNEPLEFTFGLPQVNHTFLPGHRVMVQVQSTLFPLYDRNPQKFVPNIFEAKPEDYEKATQRVWHKPGAASYVSLPVVAQ